VTARKEIGSREFFCLVFSLKIEAIREYFHAGGNNPVERKKLTM
jgi:hypothetical protein